MRGAAALGCLIWSGFLFCRGRLPVGKVIARIVPAGTFPVYVHPKETSQLLLDTGPYVFLDTAHPPM